jgi:xanthine/uracil permease
MRHRLRLRVYLCPYRHLVSISIILLLAFTGLSLTIPEVIRQVIDIGLKQSQVSFLINATLLLLGIGARYSIFTVQGLRIKTSRTCAHFLHRVK